MSSGKASLCELDTVYSVEDAYMMLEVITVDNHNRKIAEEIAAQRAKEA